MKFTAIITAIFAGIAIAAPTPTGDGGSECPGGPGTPPYDACTGLYDTAQCCATDILGVADLDCANPSAIPTSPDNFSATCAAIGQRARCCILPILDQGILCQTPAGVDD